MKFIFNDIALSKLEEMGLLPEEHTATRAAHQRMHVLRKHSPSTSPTNHACQTWQLSWLTQLNVMTESILHLSLSSGYRSHKSPSLCHHTSTCAAANENIYTNWFWGFIYISQCVVLAKVVKLPQHLGCNWAPWSTPTNHEIAPSKILSLAKPQDQSAVCLWMTQISTAWTLFSAALLLLSYKPNSACHYGPTFWTPLEEQSKVLRVSGTFLTTNALMTNGTTRFLILPPTFFI